VTTLERRAAFPLLIAPFGAALLLLGGATTLTWFLGSRNPFTPAGYVGYLTKGAVVGKAYFYGIQRGPTSAAAPGCSTSPTSALRRTPTRKTSRRTRRS
jgi:hypothetical protein